MGKAFHVGDKVTRHYVNPQEVLTVKRVMKKFIELNDASRWDLEGREKSRVYSRQYIAHWKQEDSDYIRLKQLNTKISKWVEDTINTRTLAQAEIIVATITALQAKEDMRKQTENV